MIIHSEGVVIRVEENHSFSRILVGTTSKNRTSIEKRRYGFNDHNMSGSYSIPLGLYFNSHTECPFHDSLTKTDKTPPVHYIRNLFYLYYTIINPLKHLEFLYTIAITCYKESL